MGFYDIDYPRLAYYRRRHHARYVQRVEETDDSLPCQACRGWGGEAEPVLDDSTGPWLECGWCEGTGSVTKWLRGLWLRIG